MWREKYKGRVEKNALGPFVLYGSKIESGQSHILHIKGTSRVANTDTREDLYLNTPCLQRQM
jgi:hypothetical protein